jgi:hypothetical protein
MKFAEDIQVAVEEELVLDWFFFYLSNFNSKHFLIYYPYHKLYQRIKIKFQANFQKKSLANRYTKHTSY